MGLNEKENNNSIDKTLITSLNLMYKSGLTAAEVIDLIPVKPIAGNEVQIKNLFTCQLTLFVLTHFPEAKTIVLIFRFYYFRNGLYMVHRSLI